MYSPGPSRFLCLRGLHTSRSGCAVVLPISLVEHPINIISSFMNAHEHEPILNRRKNQLMDLVSKCTGVITTNFVGREQNNAVRGMVATPKQGWCVQYYRIMMSTRQAHAACRSSNSPKCKTVPKHINFSMCATPSSDPNIRPTY